MSSEEEAASRRDEPPMLDTLTHHVCRLDGGLGSWWWASSQRARFDGHGGDTSHLSISEQHKEKFCELELFVAGKMWGGRHQQLGADAVDGAHYGGGDAADKLLYDQSGRFPAGQAANGAARAGLPLRLFNEDHAAPLLDLIEASASSRDATVSLIVLHPQGQPHPARSFHKSSDGARSRAINRSVLSRENERDCTNDVPSIPRRALLLGGHVFAGEESRKQNRKRIKRRDPYRIGIDYRVFKQHESPSLPFLFFPLVDSDDCATDAAHAALRRSSSAPLPIGTPSPFCINE
uniref:OO_Ba0005L10-OO_Ba0081K17.28 protein n=1 Tax=Oryza officinalis TaxID=4535 RepID=D0ABD9_9ORYZ|nr:OO_Ba0005L10-OO_Ba0081K17.28 [Oryza officinalis]